MLVTIQFPIADARPFGPHPDLRLSLPDWPEPETSINPQFVHYFGKAAERIKDVDEAWPDEIRFIQATRGIRFDHLEQHGIELAGRRFQPRCAFRRLFCDGRAVVRAEIGIANNPNPGSLYNLSLEDVLAVARGISEIPTKVHSIGGEQKLRPIISQGKYLARLYAHASMNRKIPDVSSGYKLVETGDPVLLIELQPSEINLDGAVKNVDGITVIDRKYVNGANAVFCRLKTRAGIISTWIIQRGSASVGQLRSLRLCLIRLHAEREVLDLILKQIHRRRLLNPPTEEAADLLDEYFNERTKVVNRKKWDGIYQSEMIAAFDATSAIVRPAIQAQLIKRYEGGRLQVWKKIKAFQEERRATRSVKVVNIEEGGIMVDKQVNVSGTGNVVNVAEYMSNVTNTVNNNLAESNADQEVKKLIDDLAGEIERIADKIDPVQLKKMGKNIEALSNEVASEEPEQRWYEVSIEGLKDAAQAVGAIADPVFSIVKKLSALLLA